MYYCITRNPCASKAVVIGKQPVAKQLSVFPLGKKQNIPGTVKYVGPVYHSNFRSGIYAGLKLDVPGKIWMQRNFQTSAVQITQFFSNMSGS